MSQLPCKLESGGLVIVFCQTKAVSKQERSSFQLVVSRVYRPGAWREAAASAAAVSPGWSASRLSPRALLWSLFFSSLLWLCVCVCMCAHVWTLRLLSGRSRSCCELARLSVSTYMTLFPKEGQRKEEKERRETRDGSRGGYNRGMERAHSSTCTKHVRRELQAQQDSQTSNFL